MRNCGASGTFRRLAGEASPDDLARASSGTRWTNRQLLFHMLLGNLITRALIVLAGMFPCLPASASRVFAGLQCWTAVLSLAESRLAEARGWERSGSAREIRPQICQSGTHVIRPWAASPAARRDTGLCPLSLGGCGSALALQRGCRA